MHSVEISVTSHLMVCLFHGVRDLWNNPIVCNCSAAWLRRPTVCLPSLSVDSQPIDRCFVDSPDGSTSFISNVNFSDCGMSGLSHMLILPFSGGTMKKV